MAEYMIRAAAEPWRDSRATYVVSKFEGGILPVQQYHVFVREDGSWGCSCPAGIHHASPCKHIAWVKQWLDLPREHAWAMDTGGIRDREGNWVVLSGLDEVDIAGIVLAQAAKGRTEP